MRLSKHEAHGESQKSNPLVSAKPQWWCGPRDKHIGEVGNIPSI